MHTSQLTKVFNLVLRYRVLHVIFWCYQFISLSHGMKGFDDRGYFIYVDTGIVVFFQILLVYFVVYYLVPVTLEKGKYVAFTGLIILSVVLGALITVGVQDLVTHVLKHRHFSSFVVLPMILSRLVEFIVLIACFLAVYGLTDKYNSERHKDKIEQEQLKAELDFLKNQLNPHFLFNAINSIYVLIREDKALAEKTLLQFSDLLRYQLYDCGTDTTLLSKELRFIRDYVSLEKMRCNQDLTITLDLPVPDDSISIAPFILVTFVENAFKHKSSDQPDNFIEIRSSLNKHVFSFDVINSVGERQYLESTHGGIGLRNVSRRLELLHRNNYKLEINRNNNHFSVHLELNLNP